MIYSYGCNTQSNEVRNFRISIGWYPVNSLNKVTVKNENGDSTVTYTDLLGLKVMEARNTVKTYYLYDDRQNTVQVIQPVASESGHTSSTNINSTTSVLDGSFVYTYDAYNRLNTKKIPSGGTTTYTYDRLDREVVRADPNGFRFFTKYDILGRVIITGKHTTSSNPTGSESLFETPTTTGYFYTSTAFPTSSIEVYSVNYYDDYDWEDNGSTDATYRGGYVDYPSSNYTWVKGKLTRTKNGRLNQNGTAPSTWMDDIIFYDIEGREIQKQSLQQLGYVDTTWRQYDFPGRLRKTQRSHMNNTTRTLISERFEYDHAGRLVDTYHKINNQAEQKISNQSYNERDELSQKQLAYVGSAYGQSIDYTYNIRKWMTQINDPAACNADLFSLKLYYTDANINLNATAKYNGNIAWMEWRTGANCLVGGVSRNKAGYGLTYDGLDRVTASKYGEYTSSWTNLNRYNENLTYDLNGNILTMGRRGYISSGNWNTIDTLSYTYGAGGNPNRVSNITDNSGSNLGYPNTSGSFTYDASGNQITYGAKGITSITYNHLNLPTKYTWSGSNLEIQYDALGRKLKKIPSTGNAKTYVGGIEYSGTSIEAIYHSEGRARLISSTWEYEYAIRDHLGNARVYFKYNGSITFLQESHYYPYGMEQGGWTAPVSPENKYKYNGKEYNDEFALGLYDYGARLYDPVVGRWGQVDPMSEKFLSFTPFNYTNNNPINFIDPDGNSTAPPRTADDSKNDANGAAMLNSPIFDRKGIFLGVDSKGYEGEILIMDRQNYNNLSENDTKIIDHQLALDASDKLNTGGLNAEGFSKVYTHVVKQMEGEVFEGKKISFDKLEGGIINIIDTKQTDDGLGFENGSVHGNPSNPPLNARAETVKNKDGSIKVTARLAYGSGLMQSVEFAQSVLGVHEYVGHGLNNLNSKQEGAAYRMQYNHKRTYNALTLRQQNEIRTNAGIK